MGAINALKETQLKIFHIAIGLTNSNKYKHMRAKTQFYLVHIIMFLEMRAGLYNVIVGASSKRNSILYKSR